MIVPFLTFVLGGGLGLWAGRKAATQAQAQQQQALPPGAEAAAAGPAALPSAPYRAPDVTAVINLPVDAEDFAQLRAAVCACLDDLRARHMGHVTSDDLRDCLLEAIYGDFQWPPVPGDPPGASMMWMIADHEARRALAGADACEPGRGGAAGGLG